MTKKQYAVCSFLGLIIGIIGGIAGTAYSMGAEQQRINDTLVQNTTEIASVDKEMDRYAEILAAQITDLHKSIRELTSTISILRTDVQVLKAIMERLERDFQKRSIPISANDT